MDRYLATILRLNDAKRAREAAAAADARHAAEVMARLDAEEEAGAPERARQAQEMRDSLAALDESTRRMEESRVGCSRHRWHAQDGCGACQEYLERRRP